MMESRARGAKRCNRPRQATLLSASLRAGQNRCAIISSSRSSLGWGNAYPATGKLFGRDLSAKSDPVVQTAHAIRASLLASATAALL